MTVSLQIRDVPEPVRDAIAEQAAGRGQSMQSYLLDLIEREANLVKNVHLFERTTLGRVSLPAEFDPERLIREDREATR